MLHSCTVRIKDLRRAQGDTNARVLACHNENVLLAYVPNLVYRYGHIKQQHSRINNKVRRCNAKPWSLNMQKHQNCLSDRQSTKKDDCHPEKQLETKERQNQRCKRQLGQTKSHEPGSRSCEKYDQAIRDCVPARTDRLHPLPSRKGHNKIEAQVVASAIQKSVHRCVPVRQCSNIFKNFPYFEQQTFSTSESYSRCSCCILSRVPSTFGNKPTAVRPITVMSMTT